MLHVILPKVLTATTGVAWSLFLADLGPNETQVILAAIGAITALANFTLLKRSEKERRVHERKVTDAIDGNGLVAMVPEKIVREVEGRQPHDRRTGDQAP